MSLTPELENLRSKLVTLGIAKRTLAQDRLLAELEAINRVDLRKSLGESTFASVTRMTSPGGDACSCCGK